MDNQNSEKPHALIFPLPAQGHITPMLNLAELFCLENFQITFIITTQNHQRLTNYTDTETRFARYPGFKFMVIPDELSQLNVKPGSSTHKDLTDWIVNMIQGLAVNVKPLIEEMIDGSSHNNVTCLVVDGWLRFAYDIANEAGIPVISFRCPSACCIWAYFCTPELIEAGEIPFEETADEDLDKLVQNVPGMQSFLRYRDLPSFCRNKDKSSCDALQHTFAAEMQRTKQAYGLIINTFEELEGPVLSFLRSQCNRVYPVGPLHAHIKHRVTRENTTLSNPSSSLWEVDQSCLSWLDQKPDKSVVYVGFGSLTILEREKIMEIWAGLVQSNKFFLWVIRPDLMIPGQNDSPTPTEVTEGTKERGCIVSWAPQEAVLSHRAVGGFLTHSGWNSTLESITAGVPMLCWPYFADQQLNSRYVSEVWGIGLDMKDTCDRNVVAEMVNDLMDVKKGDLDRSTAKMSDAAKRSVAEGGSSYSNFDRLVEDIKMMSLKSAN